MKHIKYSSITNSYMEQVINHALVNFNCYNWAVQEKIHGANFSFIIDKEGNFRVGSRNQLVDGTFFNCQQVIDRYKDKVVELANNIEFKDQITLFGELYGSKIQKEIYYSDKVEFMLFDIKIDGVYSTLTEVNYLADNFNIPSVPTLFEGTLEECLNYPNEFNSTFSNKENNICEGVVIRPTNVSQYFNNTRLIFKNKNVKFSERSVSKKVRKPKELPEHLVQFSEYEDFITDNKLINVLSHIGKIDNNSKVGVLFKEFNLDVINEVQGLGELDKKDKKIITNYLGKKASLFVKSKLPQILKGEFNV